MPVRIEPMVQPSPLAHRAVFLSASIPDPRRWLGEFDALEITDAVVAGARSVLTAGAVLVTAAHPTIAPLLLYVASEFPSSDEPRVIIYQSRLFDRVLPEPTRRFEDLLVGVVKWIDAVAGDEPAPGKWDKSLAAMRAAMFRETDPAAAIFIGGMDGIREEHTLFVQTFPKRPAYPLGRPGGEARRIAEAIESPLAEELRSADVYPAIFRRAIADLTSRIERG